MSYITHHDLGQDSTGTTGLENNSLLKEVKKNMMYVEVQRINIISCWYNIQWGQIAEGRELRQATYPKKIR